MPKLDLEAVIRGERAPGRVLSAAVGYPGEFEVDPSQVKSGGRTHHQIQNEVATWLRDFRLIPRQPRVDGLQFDLAWQVGGTASAQVSAGVDARIIRLGVVWMLIARGKRQRSNRQRGQPSRPIGHLPAHQSTAQ